MDPGTKRASVLWSGALRALEISWPGQGVGEEIWGKPKTLQGSVWSRLERDGKVKGQAQSWFLWRKIRVQPQATSQWNRGQGRREENGKRWGTSLGRKGEGKRGERRRGEVVDRKGVQDRKGQA